MKKLFLLLSIFFTIGLLLSSCTDDTSATAQQTSITVTFDNVALVDGVVYTTKDYPLEIESMELTSSDGTTKCICEANYKIDDTDMMTAKFMPFSGRISTSNLSNGNHTLELSFDLLQNDNSQVPKDIMYAIVVVPTVDDLPNGAELGTLTRTFQPTVG